MTFAEFLDKGGVLMIPILLASVVSATAFFERLWALRERRVAPEALVRGLRALLLRGQTERAESLCAADGSALAAVVTAGLRRRSGERAIVKEAMEEAGRIEAARMERFVGVTGTVATVSPLLGLLGTVTGMIKVFRDVAEQADPQIAVLASGIWEALLTTGAGLTVAIPSYLAYRYLLSRVDRLATRMEEHAVEILDFMTGATGPVAPATADPDAEGSAP